MNLLRSLTLLLICLLSLPLQADTRMMPMTSAGDAAMADCVSVACDASDDGAMKGCDSVECSAEVTCCSGLSATVIVQSFADLHPSGLPGVNEQRIFYRSADRSAIYHSPGPYHLS
ncbi:MAG: hypothetical protein OIF55_00625 [Amphritea sp.]|nr:hypothetical protein [Amphritea sp.]